MTLEDKKLEARTTENISKIKQILRPAKELLNEGILQVEEDRIKFIAADPAMVGLVNFTIKADYWDTYEVEEEFQAGANIEDLFQFVKSATNDEELVLEYGQGDTSPLWMNTIKAEHGLTFKAGLPVLNLKEDDIPSIGDLDFNSEFRVDTEMVKRILEIISGKADSMRFTIKEDQLEIEANTSDDRYTNLDTIIEEGEKLKIDQFEEESSSRFSRQYLETQMTGRTIPSLTDEVKVQMGTDFPLKISTEDEEISYTFVLAPRIDEE
jgi:DNA polymerase III sliding clamp (beta) subunit (PCNA family)